jgi:mRNA interferase MazF
LKEKLHDNSANRPHISEGEVWWASFGENIGFEISGKGELFTRPAIVFKKLTSNKLLAIPTTSQDKNGSWYIAIQYSEHRVTAILSEARAIDTRRLTTRIGRLSLREFKRVKEGFKTLYCR